MRRIQFSIKTLLIITLLVSICLALMAFNQTFALYVVLSIAVANAIGIGVALLITHVLRFPTDGGFRDKEIRAPEKKCDPISLEAIKKLDEEIKRNQDLETLK